MLCVWPHECAQSITLLTRHFLTSYIFKESYLSTRFVTGSSSHTDTHILNILPPDLDKCSLVWSELRECYFNDHFPSLLLWSWYPFSLCTIGSSSPPQTRVISLPIPFMAFFHLFLIHYHSINFHLWLTYSVNLYAACCIFKQDHFSTCFQVALQSWKRRFSCDSHLQVVFWVFASSSFFFSQKILKNDLMLMLCQYLCMPTMSTSFSFVLPYVCIVGVLCRSRPRRFCQ